MNGLSFDINEKWISNKIFSVKMLLSIVETANLTDWTIQMDNKIMDMDIDNRAIVQLIKDAYFGPWNSWSSCSKVRFEPRTKKSQSSDSKTIFMHSFATLSPDK